MAEGNKRMEHEREMRVVLREWERSGLPVARFADQVGMVHCARWATRSSTLRIRPHREILTSTTRAGCPGAASAWCSRPPRRRPAIAVDHGIRNT